jgi:DNA/RNA endonuclease G (NUC1)
MVDLAGTTVSTTFTWTSDTPALATIDQNGVMHSLAAGQAVFRATATNGTSVTYSLPTAVATLGGTAEYVGNAEFGIPTDGNASDDFIINRDQYTISYNQNRNTPNWVSYEFDASHFQAPGGDNIDRCDCFTHDPALPASFTHLTTADYTGAGAFAGYGIDRGHMARSFDFTSGTLDNARSYYLSNIIPQAAAVNQGPWKILEDTLGNLARFDNKEVYIIDGVAGNKGTVKGEGKIVMPAYVWKVAVILPRNHRLSDVHDYTDIDDVIAVIMPNDPTINSDWKTYKTTVDEVERTSGYDLLALLPDKLEAAVESNTILAAKALDQASVMVSSLASNAGLNAGETNALLAKIDAAQQQLGIGNATPAANQLKALLKQLTAMVSSGRITDADAAPLRSMIQGLIDSIA